MISYLNVGNALAGQYFFHMYPLVPFFSLLLNYPKPYNDYNTNHIIHKYTQTQVRMRGWRVHKTTTTECVCGGEARSYTLVLQLK